VIESLREPGAHPLISLPTGAGKSIVQAEIVRRLIQEEGADRIFCVTHRRELIRQNAEKLRMLLPDERIGIFSAGLRRKDVMERVICAQIQSCYQSVGQMCAMGKVSHVIIDEAHLFPHTGSGQYRKWWERMAERNPDIRCAGMSATCYRTDSGDLTDGHIFTEIAYEAGLRRLIQEGYLCALISKSTAKKAHANLKGIRKQRGEFSPGQLQEVMNQEALIEATLDEIFELADDRQSWLIFCAGVAHAEAVRDAIQKRGVQCETVTGKTEPATRDRILEDLKTGRLRAVTNADVLTTGFDGPRIDLIGLLRPTLSPGLFVQMVGRGLRLHPEKDDTLVLDFGGNIDRHGTLDAIQIKERRESEGSAPTKVCKACQAEIPTSAVRCPICGAITKAEREPPKHDAEAYEGAIIGDSDPLEPVQEVVERVEYALHRGKMGKPDSLRVTYRLQGKPVPVSEWVCLVHDGWARMKAERWWLRRSLDGEHAPETMEEALVRAPALLQPQLLSVVYPPGKYPKIRWAKRFVDPYGREPAAVGG